MTAFGLVMLGKLFFLVFCLFVFCCCCVFTSESSIFSLILNIFIFFRLHRQDVHRPKLFHFGGKKGRTRRATPA